jgi:hypothetical protein
LQLPIDDEKQNQKLIHSKDDHWMFLSFFFCY